MTTQPTPTSAPQEDLFCLPHGVVRMCAGVVESLDRLPPAYRAAVERAAAQVGRSFAPDAEPLREKLVEAILLSLMNRKEYSFAQLEAKLQMGISVRTFSREKARFCQALARELHWQGSACLPPEGEPDDLARRVLEELAAMAFGERLYPEADRGGATVMRAAGAAQRLKALELLGRRFDLFGPGEERGDALDVNIQVVE